MDVVVGRHDDIAVIELDVVCVHGLNNGTCVAGESMRLPHFPPLDTLSIDDAAAVSRCICCDAHATTGSTIEKFKIWFNFEILVYTWFNL
jgi:hypothetical protein